MKIRKIGVLKLNTFDSSSVVTVKSPCTCAVRFKKFLENDDGDLDSILFILLPNCSSLITLQAMFRKYVAGVTF